MRIFAEKVHLHVDSIIEGQLTLAATDQETLFGVTMPDAAWLLCIVIIFNMLLVSLFWKEIVASVFDPDHAQLQGIKPQLMHQVIMIMTAVTTIAAFEAVGSILVVALMVIPPATAMMLSNRLIPIICISIILGVSAAFIGHVLAVMLPGPLSHMLLDNDMAQRVSDSSSAGMIAVVNGVLFFAVALVRHYILKKWKNRSKTNQPADMGTGICHHNLQQ